jgi:hypothetical protein
VVEARAARQTIINLTVRYGMAAVGIDRSDPSSDQTAASGLTKEAADASPETSSQHGLAVPREPSQNRRAVALAKVAGRGRRGFNRVDCRHFGPG